MINSLKLYFLHLVIYNAKKWTGLFNKFSRLWSPWKRVFIKLAQSEPVQISQKIWQGWEKSLKYWGTGRRHLNYRWQSLHHTVAIMGWARQDLWLVLQGPAVATAWAMQAGWWLLMQYSTLTLAYFLCAAFGPCYISLKDLHSWKIFNFYFVKCLYEL